MQLTCILRWADNVGTQALRCGVVLSSKLGRCAVLLPAPPPTSYFSRRREKSDSDVCRSI